MRARIGLAVAAIAVVSSMAVVPAIAGSPLQYEGNVEHDDSTFFGFDVVKSNGKTKIKNIEAALAYTCRGGGGGVGFGGAKGSLTVKNGKFHGKLKGKFQSSRGTSFRLSYTISGRAPQNGLAHGTVSSLLTPITARGAGPTQPCYSGRVDWQVSKNGSRN